MSAVVRDTSNQRSITMLDDPMYLCGVYSEKLRSLRIIVSTFKGYVSNSEIAILKALLDMPDRGPDPIEPADELPSPKLEPADEPIF
jgi:hypothetical protein